VIHSDAPDRARMNRWVPCCLLLAIVAVWGWTFTLMKGALASYGVVAFLAVRFVIGALAIGLFSARRVDRRSLGTGALIGIVLAGAYLLQTFALRETTATNTGLVTGLFIVFAPLANRMLFGVRTPPRLWGAIGISVVGLVLLTGTSRLALGDALALGCAAGFGLQIALLDRYAKRHDAVALALGQVATAAVLFLVIWPLVEPVACPPVGVWFSLLVTGLVATAAAFFVQTYAQQRLSAVETGVIIVTEPVFAAAFGFLLAGDRLTATQCLGAALMVGALVVTQVYLSLVARDPARAPS
jgi:drug/metabolite transporter (DMT)-like permease